jgi:hypothetical protein
MTRLAYFDLANGISGDMALSALVGAGRPLDAPVADAIHKAVASLDLGASVSFVDDERGGIACVRAEVTTDGRRHTAKGLREAIERSDTSERARTTALRSLDALVEAEARVHGVDPDDVHLHELASADTAVDLLGAAVGLETLEVDRVAAAPVPVPAGWIAAEHGPLPLPTPVTLELLAGARLKGVDADKELVTPSGAAILVGHAATFGPLPEMTLAATGIGGGRRKGERPNICRVLVGDAYETAGPTIETCVLLETNIDDQTPEWIGHAIERLIAEGVLDAWVQPIVMKKSRPAFQVGVLVRTEDESRIAARMFHLTTTLGIRRRTITRYALEREWLTVLIEGHEIRVKVARLDGDVTNVAPEFADCVTVADATGIRPADVYEHAASLARAELGRA